MHRLDTVAFLHSCFFFSALSCALDHIPNAFALAQACHKTDLHLTFFWVLPCLALTRQSGGANSSSPSILSLSSSDIFVCNSFHSILFLQFTSIVCFLFSFNSTQCCQNCKLVESGSTNYRPCQRETGPVSSTEIHMFIAHTPLFTSILMTVPSRLLRMCGFLSSSIGTSECYASLHSLFCLEWNSLFTQVSDLFTITSLTRGNILSNITFPAAPESMVTLTFTHLSFTSMIFFEFEFHLDFVSSVDDFLPLLIFTLVQQTARLQIFLFDSCFFNVFTVIFINGEQIVVAYLSTPRCNVAYLASSPKCSDSSLTFFSCPLLLFLARPCCHGSFPPSLPPWYPFSFHF